MGIVDRYGGVLGRFFVYLIPLQIYAIHFLFIPYCLMRLVKFRVFIYEEDISLWSGLLPDFE